MFLSSDPRQDKPDFADARIEARIYRAIHKRWIFRHSLAIFFSRVYGNLFSVEYLAEISEDKDTDASRKRDFTRFSGLVERFLQPVSSSWSVVFLEYLTHFFLVISLLRSDFWCIVFLLHKFSPNFFSPTERDAFLHWAKSIGAKVFHGVLRLLHSSVCCSWYVNFGVSAERDEEYWLMKANIISGRVDWSIYQMIDWLIGRMIDWLIDWMVDYRMIDWLIEWFSIR